LLSSTGDLVPSDTRMRQFAQRRPLVTFFALAFGLGWLVALPLVLSPAGLGVIQLNLPEEWLMLFSTTPTLAALGTQWLIAGNFRICRLGSPWRVVLLGAVFSAILALLAFAIVPALVLTNGAVGALGWSALVTASLPWWSNPFNLLGGPLNEEPGWRGFALPRLQARYGPLTASLVLGSLWFLWHAPLFLVHDWLSVPIWAFGILILCLSVLMTWVVNRSGGGVISAMVTHAVFNSSFPILIGLCHDLPTRDPGLTWYLVGVGVTTLIAIGATRGRLGYMTAAAAA
jgi:membrane protease YdiL (CAAX protease family)